MCSLQHDVWHSLFSSHGTAARCLHDSMWIGHFPTQPLVPYLSLFGDAFSCAILDSNLLLIHNGQIFHQLVYNPTIVLPPLTLSLDCFIDISSLVHAPLGVIINFLTLLRFFTFKSVLS